MYESFMVRAAVTAYLNYIDSLNMQLSVCAQIPTPARPISVEGQPGFSSFFWLRMPTNIRNFDSRPSGALLRSTSWAACATAAQKCAFEGQVKQEQERWRNGPAGPATTAVEIKKRERKKKPSPQALRTNNKSNGARCCCSLSSRCRHNMSALVVTPRKRRRSRSVVIRRVWSARGLGKIKSLFYIF